MNIWVATGIRFYRLFPLRCHILVVSLTMLRMTWFYTNASHIFSFFDSVKKNNYCAVGLAQHYIIGVGVPIWQLSIVCVLKLHASNIYINWLNVGMIQYLETHRYLFSLSNLDSLKC